MAKINNRGTGVNEMGSSYAMFDDGTDQTILPIVGGVALSGDTSVSKFYNAGGKYGLYNSESAGEVTVTVAPTTDIARQWTSTHNGVTGKLWLNLVGEDNSSGTKSLVLIPFATISENLNLTLPGVVMDYKFIIGAATAPESLIPTPAETDGWPYTSTGTVNVVTGNRIVFKDLTV